MQLYIYYFVLTFFVFAFEYFHPKLLQADISLEKLSCDNTQFAAKLTEHHQLSTDALQQKNAQVVEY